MLPVYLDRGRVHIGRRFSVSFQRTAVSEPAGHSRGALPVQLSGDAASVPRLAGEGIWLGFSGEQALPVAVQVCEAGRSLIDGSACVGELRQHPRNYLVAPVEPMWPPRGSPPLAPSEIELFVYEPVAPDEPPPRSKPRWDVPFFAPEGEAGNTPQEPEGPEKWSAVAGGRLAVTFVEPDEWRRLTGEEPPPPAEPHTPGRLP